MSAPIWPAGGFDVGALQVIALTESRIDVNSRSLKNEAVCNANVHRKLDQSLTISSR
jgi:hypothetical protein